MLCFGKKHVKDPNKRISYLIDKQIERESKLKKNNVRVLLLGASESGKTTVLKQMKIIHLNGFTTEERLAKKAEIYGNIHTAIYTLIANLKNVGIQIGPAAFKSSIKILEIGPYAPKELTSEYIEHIRFMWCDKGIQELHEQRYNFFLIDNAKYFLDQLDVIFADDYIPTQADILHSRTTSHGVDEIKFDIKEDLYKYNLTFVDIGGCTRTKWVQFFEGVSIVIFVVACSTFNELDPITEENRLFGSLDLFRKIWHNKFLRNSSVIVFLNKIDQLEEKVAQGIKISRYFFDYSYFDLKYGDGEAVFDVTKHFIRYKFEKITSEPTTAESMFDRKSIMRRECKLHFLIATNTDNCREIYEKCKQSIVMRALKIYELE